ncbi:MAG: nucleotidyltransferase family protein [Anaerolineales bacterium]
MYSAVVLAAGQSRRMGRPKMTLSWGNTTVIGRVLQALESGGVDNVLIVTGAARVEVEKAVSGFGVRTVFNPFYAEAEMIKTLQVGISALNDEYEAALVVLGDQPQLRPKVVRGILDTYQESQAALIVPSFEMQRGHPWLLGRTYWPEILSLPSSETLRDFLNRHAAEIHYLIVNSKSVLQDLDTPEDYQHYRPKS